MREASGSPWGTLICKVGKELPTGKAQNSRCYKDSSVITNILITTKETKNRNVQQKWVG